jgi:cytochrome b561
MSTPKRYHPLLVTLHWLIAALVIFNLLLGFTQLGATPNDDAKIQALSLHMPIGISLLVLMIVRLFVRFFTPKPEPATAGNPILDKIGVVVHYLLYIVVLAMGLTGMGTSALAGLTAIVFERTGTLPPDFAVFPPAIGHGFFSYVLSGLVALHVGAALFHQFIRRDNLLSRMWFGKE